MKAITVTFNPSLDHTLYFDGHFVPGALNRAKQATTHAGGKGINVARMFRLLGIQATAFGFMGGDGGKTLARKMLEEKIDCHFVKTEAETRGCYKMIDQYGLCTEANEAGGPIAEEELRRLINSIDSFLQDGSKEEMTYLFLGGSIPAGIKKGIYAAMIRKYNREHTRVILDADGEALRLGLEERPWLIKPNQAELSELAGRTVKTVADAARISRIIQRNYQTNVICTMGENGAVYTDAVCSLYVSAPPVELRGFTGAGDTFLTSFVYAFEKSGGDSETALRFAAGAAAAKIEMTGTALPGKDRITKFLDKSYVKQIVSSAGSDGKDQ